MSIERGIERVIYNGIESGPEIGHSDVSVYLFRHLNLPIERVIYNGMKQLPEP